MVDEPSKPQSGSCSRLGNASKSFSWVLPRRLGTGVYPSSQIYSSLYFVIRVSHWLITRCVSERCQMPGNRRRAPAVNCWPACKHVTCHSAAFAHHWLKSAHCSNSISPPQQCYPKKQ